MDQIVVTITGNNIEQIKDKVILMAKSFGQEDTKIDPTSHQMSLTDLAPEPKATKTKATKAKAAQAPTDFMTDEPSAEVAEEQTPVTKTKNTKQEAQDALASVFGTPDGPNKARMILLKFNKAIKFSQIKEADYPALIAACQDA